MIALHDHAVGDQLIVKFAPCLLGLRPVHVERSVPARIAHEQCLDVGGIGGGQQLLAAGADEVGGVALGMAVRRDGADAGRNFGFAVHDANITSRGHQISFPVTVGFGAKATIEATRLR